ncbi:cobyrinate a,c-diamide synthase [Oceanidesulfovibrio indonesiensis]|uniref:Cobyrinate a,c-diamide synthase n=1 Tax=Oceanidesulfovibrio indonesiensis TaxID=54767 RepID=A0A7M3MFT4_9BACT|nr:cobyrinate a,c-diamide synthase [Oceanidesulfovibrio indonesiensis]TVM17975.1 cobyrinate a,c-diamide synthase [Oceanidesulfovibrio indonesiensis]
MNEPSDKLCSLRGLAVAAPRSGSGKTLFTLGLLASFTRRSHTVQAYKAGPDFIDPGHHTALTGRPSQNLDGWMLGRRSCQDIFARSARRPIQDRVPDILLLEGVMGLFDGASGRTETGSTAELAKWLGLPVLIVLDARSMARTAAAIAHGLATFDPGLPVAGVVLNRVSSATHRELLEESFEALDLPLLGCLMNDAEMDVPSRHLGLVTAEDRPTDATFADRLADWVESGVDVEKLLHVLPDVSRNVDICAAANGSGITAEDADNEGACRPVDLSMNLDAQPAEMVVRIAVARDAAFSFYYDENLRLLEAAGAELAFFSPLADSALPKDIGGVYLGGGYPELHADALANNVKLREEIRKRSLRGLPVYAECGGYMYLMRSLTDGDGRRLLMAGVFPWAAVMDSRRRGLGYREVTTTADTLLGPAGTVLRGHEFHYSFTSEFPDDAALLDAGVQPVYAVTDRRGELLTVTGYSAGGVLASYVHLHFGSNPQAARCFVERCRTYWNKENV